ncbi:CPBP family intramembrane metalloprotease [Pseudooceanicola sp. CBS1P-1]|uniref:CPBP family intramembrane metalloprotease n=1 Tax=Pseudooceanicola albus TaxID=2692189 RepID=A0A6L7G823_9RHOB|nr:MULTISPECIES: type II CAAX endopeptidase family protein [Pseudooceanicola]MBT9384108.1 CPBP family intramembrane metalloprotease [Pseudooceanicola endophyticus]MXN19792.1 CPBP family intramembrane metalloprotease [Pseudooceanicola albus]
MIPTRPGARPAYAPHAAYIAAARADNAPIWRIALGLLLVEMLFAGGLSLFDGLTARLSPDLADEVFYGDTARGLIVQLASYAVLGLGVAAVVRVLHGRSPATLFGPAPLDHRRLWRLLRTAFLGAMAFYILVQLLPPWDEIRATQTIRPPLHWLAALPFALLALLLQTASEEMLYRGYLQQLLAARFTSAWIWMGLPNLAFAAVHWEEGGAWIENWQYVIWAFCFGLACSDLAARTGSLAPGIGLHLANNAYAFLFFGDLNGPDSGLALFLFPAYDPLMPEDAAFGPILSLPLCVELLILLLGWLSARLALRR